MSQFILVISSVILNTGVPSKEEIEAPLYKATATLSFDLDGPRQETLVFISQDKDRGIKEVRNRACCFIEAMTEYPNTLSLAEEAGVLSAYAGEAYCNPQWLNWFSGMAYELRRKKLAHFLYYDEVEEKSKKKRSAFGCVVNMHNCPEPDCKTTAQR